MTGTVNTASLKDRREFWKFPNAVGSFEEAKAACDELLGREPDPEDPLLSLLTVALVITYGRPFQQRQPLRLPVAVVPQEFRETHSFLIELRDKMYAHTDLDGPVPDKGGETLNRVLVNFSGEYYSTARLILVLRKQELRRVQALLDVLTEKMDYHSNKAWAKCEKNGFGLPDGKYEVSISSEGDRFLVPHFDPLKS